MPMQQSDSAAQISEDYKILTEDSDGHGTLFQLLGHRDWKPEAAHVFAARLHRPHTGQINVVFKGLSDVISPEPLIGPSGGLSHFWLPIAIA